MILKNLFSSSIRADILSLLLSSPDEQFYVREIANLLGKNPSGVKRELDNLEGMDILVSERVANLRYFQANQDSPFYFELKSLITKSLGLPGALKAVLRAVGTKSAFIYGPYAEGEDVGKVSLLVIGPEASVDREFKDLKNKFGYTINWIEMEESEYRRKRRKKDSSLMRILSGKRISLIGRA